MALLALVILREGFQLTGVVLGALLGQETQVSVARALELTMRHLGGFFWYYEIDVLVLLCPCVFVKMKWIDRESSIRGLATLIKVKFDKKESF